MERQRFGRFDGRFALIEIAILLSGSLMLASASGARAAEAFLCGPDKVVYVRSEDLEARKHSDPCIAAYFGIKIGDPVKLAAPDVSLVAQPAIAGAVPAVAAPIPKTKAAVALKTLTDKDMPQHAIRLASRGRVVRSVVSAPGTDYRNIHVLNAQDSEEEWFRHTR